MAVSDEEEKQLIGKEVLMQEVFVLLADGAGTSHPWGAAVTTEEEAKRYVIEGGISSHSYAKVRIFKTYEEARKET